MPKPRSAAVQFQRHSDQPLPERFEHSPIAPFAGVGQRRAGDPAANAKVVELGTLRVETGHQIAQALAPSELRVGKAQEVRPRREILDAMVRPETLDQMLEVCEWNEIQQLREHRPAAIHSAASSVDKNGNGTAWRSLAVSNRRNPQPHLTPCQDWRKRT